MDNWIDSFKNAARIDETQTVIIPWEPEYFLEMERTKNGIPLNEKVILDLQDLAHKFNLSL
jgi:LDH2 family malate/lactate/ureidoglycolate dehydrogenase